MIEKLTFFGKMQSSLLVVIFSAALLPASPATGQNIETVRGEKVVGDVNNGPGIIFSRGTDLLSKGMISMRIYDIQDYYTVFFLYMTNLL